MEIKTSQWIYNNDEPQFFPLFAATDIKNGRYDRLHSGLFHIDVNHVSAPIDTDLGVTKIHLLTT